MDNPKNKIRNMIPKIIHYCWFGRGTKPQLALECIESWKKYLPDYEIKEWNEDNFDLDMYPYAREAYDNRKFAFVTDVVRLYALYTEGGIYMDTDVEVLRSYNPFLHHSGFSGFESFNRVPTGTMACEKGGKYAKDNLAYYEGRHFVKDDGSLDLTTNVVTITNYFKGLGLVLNNTLQDFPGVFTMYPNDYFCPKDYETKKLNITDNTVCIHHFDGSWKPKTAKLKRNFIIMVGPKITTILVLIKSILKSFHILK